MSLAPNLATGAPLLGIIAEYTNQECDMQQDASEHNCAGKRVSSGVCLKIIAGISGMPSKLCYTWQ
jgi:hypothetical protein